MGLPYRVLRALLFRLDPERSHHLALSAAELASSRRWVRKLVDWWYAFRDPVLHSRAMGLEFPNPLGLAAGFDKDARAVPLLASLGFGHVEVGSVLARPWSGNPLPRVFRLPRDGALVNRLGLPSEGASRVATRLGRAYPGVPVGANVARAGPAEGRPASELAAELVEAAVELAPRVSYLTLNGSCPNTGDGRLLEDRGILREVLAELGRRLGPSGPPMLLKLSPDLGEAEAEALATTAIEAGAQGLICGNTTTRRDGLSTPAATLEGIGRGGLSGTPLLERTLARIARMRRHLGPGPALVACGGISTGRDVYRAIRAGADLAQIYTALVYRGPGAPSTIARELAYELRAAGAPCPEAVRGLDL